MELHSKISNAISKGVEFLYKNQLPYGEFKTYISADKSMKGECKYVSTTYITTFVVYSLGFIKDVRVDGMTRKAMDFLRQEMEGHGIWRFFSTNRSMKVTNGSFVKYTPISVVPDLDDTACAAHCLKKSGIDIPGNAGEFLNNRNADGIFYTWLLGYPKKPEFDENTFFLEPGENDADCGVISNILLYLGDNEETLASSRYIKKTIKEGKEDENIRYFPDKLTLYYLISRAFFNGTQSLEEVKDIILKRTKELFEKDNGFSGVLYAAYIVCVLLNYNCFDNLLHKAAEYVLNAQKCDGSWQKERFCDGLPMYYGSSELTTAISLEALSRYERWIKHAD